MSPISVDADAVNAPPNVEEEYRDVVADHADETATSDSSLVPAADVSDAGVDDVATLPSRCRQGHTPPSSSSRLQSYCAMRRGYTNLLSAIKNSILLCINLPLFNKLVFKICVYSFSLRYQLLVYPNLFIKKTNHILI